MSLSSGLWSGAAAAGPGDGSRVFCGDTALPTGPEPGLLLGALVGCTTQTFDLVLPPLVHRRRESCTSESDKSAGTCGGGLGLTSAGGGGAGACVGAGGAGAAVSLAANVCVRAPTMAPVYDSAPGPLAPPAALAADPLDVATRFSVLTTAVNRITFTLRHHSSFHTSGEAVTKLLLIDLF